MDIKKMLQTASSAVIGFFTKEQKATKTSFNKLDSAEIILALIPAAIFGCLIFGLPAVINLAVSVALSIGLELLWNIIFKRNKGFNYEALIFGILAGLTLSDRLSIIITAAVNVVAFTLRKTVFKNSPMQILAPWLLARTLFSFVFFGSFTSFSIPFLGSHGIAPIDSMLQLSEYTYPAKYLFFGVHSGNIGETSVLLLSIGGIYLILRRIINPLIPVFYIVTSAVISFAFGENLALSLMGGGIFMAAFFMALDYSLVSAPLYKKLLFGVACGVLTFVIRLIFKTEGAYFAVIIAECIFLCVTRCNIKRLINFIKNPDFKKLLNKLVKAFSV